MNRPAVLDLITPADLENVYTGKDGKCCCGCVGRHFEDEKNKRRVIDLVKKHEGKFDVGEGGEYISADGAGRNGDRVYILYLTTPGQDRLARALAAASKESV